MMEKFKKYDKYVPTGIGWLGDIPNHWKTKKGKYLFQIRKRIVGELGYDILSITQRGIKIKNIKNGGGQLAMDYSKYQLAEKGDFAMNHMDLLTGYVDISKYRGVVSPDYRVFSLVDKECYNKYFLYLFQMGYKSKIFFAYGQGSSQLGRWRLPASAFKNFVFPYPKKVEQIKIVNFLDTRVAQIDNYIQLKEKTITLLEERKAAIINQAVTKGIDPTVPMKDSGIEWLGEIPAHWEVKKLKFTVSKVGSGVTPSGGATTYIDKGIPLLRSQNIHFDRIDLSEVAFINERVHNKMKGSKVYPNDVLLNITGGSLGRCYFVTDEFEEANVNQHVCILRPKNIDSKFLYFLLMSKVGHNQIWSSQYGGGREGLNFQSIKNFNLPNPLISEQREIVGFLEKKIGELSKEIDTIKKEITLIKEYKESLIAATVTGKINVSTYKTETNYAQSTHNGLI